MFHALTKQNSSKSATVNYKATLIVTKMQTQLSLPFVTRNSLQLPKFQKINRLYSNLNTATELLTKHGPHELRSI